VKKILFIISFFALTGSVNAQNLKVEYQYLYLINKQNKLDIIKDNLRNAELVAYQIIAKPDAFQEYGNVFFTELAESYLKTEDYHKLMFTLIRKYCFFSDTSVNKSTEHLLILINDLNNRQDYIKQIIKQLNKCSQIKEYDKKLLNLIRFSLSEKLWKADELIREYIKLYENICLETLPDWLIQYNFYTQIGIESKDKYDLISFMQSSNTPFHIHNDLNKKQKALIMKYAKKYHKKMVKQNR